MISQRDRRRVYYQLNLCSLINQDSLLSLIDDGESSGFIRVCYFFVLILF